MNASYTYYDGLETARLVTRFISPADVSPWADFFRDKDALEFLSVFGFNSPEAMAGFWIEKQLLRYREKRFGLQALILKTTNEYIGHCGLVTQQIDGKPELEVGYHLIKKYWGQGYAPEAARCFINFAFRHHLAPSVISIIDTNNTRSQRVAEKNGLQRTQHTIWAHHEVYVYRIDHPKWQENKI